jgi:hypothetical protein
VAATGELGAHAAVVPDEHAANDGSMLGTHLNGPIIAAAGWQANQSPPTVAASFAGPGDSEEWS